MESQAEPQHHELRVFGFSAERGRIVFLLLGVLAMLCMGTVYSWSIFRKPLQELHGIQSTASLLPFTVMLVMYAVCMPFAGAHMNRLGPGRMMALGALLIGTGYVLTGFATSTPTLVLCYGVLGGAGVGIAYGAPLAVSAAWFPDKKGLAMGLTMVGFGLSPLVTAPLAKFLMDQLGVQQTFWTLGGAFLCVLLLVSCFMRYPPPAWSPKSVLAVAASGSSLGRYPDNLLRTPVFHILCACYTIGTFVGLSVIGISSSVAQEVVRLPPETAAILVSLFAVFNGLGRPLFGWLADHRSPRFAAVLSFVLILSASLTMLTVGEGNVIRYAISFCVFWMCLGGWLALAPTATLKLFDPARYAGNYGLVFTAYGVGALSGTLVTGVIRDLTGSYSMMFVPTAALAIVGMFLAARYLKPGDLDNG
ncbi:MAG: OFA family MFS transporter [Kiritimatiellae bacterium]|nr:OFA family MFS transporter [Kiritimatiellia bacterium]